MPKEEIKTEPQVEYIRLPLPSVESSLMIMCEELKTTNQILLKLLEKK